jgi:hypothetical protein
MSHEGVHAMTRHTVDPDEMEAGAGLCEEATIPSDQLRELIHLAKLGQAMEEYHDHHF